MTLVPDESASWVGALAEGNLAPLAEPFERAGFAASTPAPGILQVGAQDVSQQRLRLRLLLSVGVHGDETAPIEMLAQSLQALACVPHALMVELLVVVGNLAAVAQRRRFVELDLNRLFRLNGERSGTSYEEARADEIMRATSAFFAGTDAQKWHLDLHTAIRDSYFSTFAVVPADADDRRLPAMLDLLSRAGIGAAILNSAPAGTYSAYTATAFGATSATLELGRVGLLGENDLTPYADTRQAIDALLRNGVPPQRTEPMAVFQVVQELIKRSDAFRMHVARDAKNFTPLPPGALIAEDVATQYRVGAEEEYLVFPNPDVHKGLRAGLMVARVN
jgi:succinylglutamate desuccinylase